MADFFILSQQISDIKNFISKNHTMRLTLNKTKELNLLRSFILDMPILFRSNHLKFVQSNDDLTYLQSL